MENEVISILQLSEDQVVNKLKQNDPNIQIPTNSIQKYVLLYELQNSQFSQDYRNIMLSLENYNKDQWVHVFKIKTKCHFSDNWSGNKLIDPITFEEITKKNETEIYLNPDNNRCYNPESIRKLLNDNPNAVDKFTNQPYSNQVYTSLNLRK